MSKVRMSIKVDESIHRELKIVSVTRGIDMQDILETLAREWLQGRIDVPELRSGEDKRRKK